MRKLVLLVAACHVPPPHAPAPIVPQPHNELGPPPQGSTTVLIGTDQPVIVEDVTGEIDATAYGRHGAPIDGVTLRPVCLSTPCAAHLTQGPHLLVFTHPDGTPGGDTALEVGAHPMAFRYALGRDDGEARATGGFLLGGGLAAAATGLLVVTKMPDIPGTTAAGVMSLAGALAAVVGMVILSDARDQPGAGTAWQLSGSP
jgi:hypothetical protein